MFNNSGGGVGFDFGLRCRRDRGGCGKQFRTISQVFIAKKVFLQVEVPSLNLCLFSLPSAIFGQQGARHAWVTEVAFQSHCRCLVPVPMFNNSGGGVGFDFGLRCRRDRGGCGKQFRTISQVFIAKKVFLQVEVPSLNLCLFSLPSAQKKHHCEFQNDKF